MPPPQNLWVATAWRIRPASTSSYHHSSAIATIIDAIAREEQAELERREREYRAGQTPAELKGRVVVLVDDGLATGSTMKAAVEAVRAQARARIVVAVPVGSPETCQEFAEVARTSDPEQCLELTSPLPIKKRTEQIIETWSPMGDHDERVSDSGGITRRIASSRQRPAGTRETDDAGRRKNHTSTAAMIG